MDDFTVLIRGDGGDWAESECLGNHAVVKVRASAATLATINATPGFVGISKSRLDDPLSDLTSVQKTAITNKLQGLGYTLAEIQAGLGANIGTKTLGDVLRFAVRRRLKPRYDQATDTIVLDGAVQPTSPVEHVDAVI